MRSKGTITVKSNEFEKGNLKSFSLKYKQSFGGQRFELMPCLYIAQTHFLAIYSATHNLVIFNKPRFKALGSNVAFTAGPYKGQKKTIAIENEDLGPEISV